MYVALLKGRNKKNEKLLKYYFPFDTLLTTIVRARSDRPTNYEDIALLVELFNNLYVENFFDYSIKNSLGNVLILEDDTTRPISHNQEIYNTFSLFNAEKCDTYQCFITSFIDNKRKVKRPIPASVTKQQEYEFFRQIYYSTQRKINVFNFAIRSLKSIYDEIKNNSKILLIELTADQSDQG